MSAALARNATGPFVVLVGLLGGCRGPAVGPAAADEVMAALRSLEAADNAGDADAIAAHYAEDAVLHPPRGSAVRGRSQVRARYQDGLAQFALEVNIQASGVEIAGDCATCWGHTTGRFVWRDERTPTAFRDRYLMTLRRSATGWQIAHLMWCRSDP
ncbi:MAG: DUF4440 domain-containing protein [Planctomycetota bacterium]